MEYQDLSAEQQAKLDACKTPEDILALAKEEGVELTPEQLELLSGGNQASERMIRWRHYRL